MCRQSILRLLRWPEPPSIVIHPYLRQAMRNRYINVGHTGGEFRSPEAVLGVPSRWCLTQLRDEPRPRDALDIGQLS